MISEDAIAQAIGDPGSIVGRRYWEKDETVTRWSTRAVMTLLAVEYGGYLPHVDEPPYSETWGHG